MEKINIIMKNRKIIILAYPGSGKSYLIKKYKNVVDNDFCYFKFLYDKPAREMTEEELESRKGNKEVETLNPHYPDNLIKSTLKEVKNNIEVIMIYPSKEDFQHFITRYKKRGNSDVFMKYNHITQFDEWVKIFDQEKDFVITHIGSNEYLEQVLNKLKINLVEK